MLYNFRIGLPIECSAFTCAIALTFSQEENYMSVKTHGFRKAVFQHQVEMVV